MNVKIHSLLIYSFVFLLFISALNMDTRAIKTITPEPIIARKILFSKPIQSKEKAREQITQKRVKNAFRQGCLG
jgi:hypothetical protein